MFCPPNYDNFVRVFVGFDEWLRFFVEKSINYGDPFALAGKDRRTLNKTASNFRMRMFRIYLSTCENLTICSTDGTILEVEAMTILESPHDYWSTDWFPDYLKISDYEFFFIERETGIITLKHWRDDLSEVMKAGVRDDWIVLQHLSQILSKFEGWAVCVTKEEADTMQAFIVRYLRLPATVWIEVDGESGSTQGVKRIGRPPLAKARAEFEKMGFEKGNMSWEQISRYLERETGEKPSPKTLRTWASEASIDPSPRE